MVAVGGGGGGGEGGDGSVGTLVVVFLVVGVRSDLWLVVVVVVVEEDDVGIGDFIMDGVRTAELDRSRLERGRFTEVMGV